MSVSRDWQYGLVLMLAKQRANFLTGRPQWALKFDSMTERGADGWNILRLSQEKKIFIAYVY